MNSSYPAFSDSSILFRELNWVEPEIEIDNTVAMLKE